MICRSVYFSRLFAELDQAELSFFDFKNVVATYTMV